MKKYLNVLSFILAATIGFSHTVVIGMVHLSPEVSAGDLAEGLGLVPDVPTATITVADSVTDTTGLVAAPPPVVHVVERVVYVPQAQGSGVISRVVSGTFNVLSFLCKHYHLVGAAFVFGALFRNVRAARAEARAARIAAVGARTAALGAETAALGAGETAEAARVAAVDASGAANGARSAAEAARVAALGAKTAAGDARVAANGARIDIAKLRRLVKATGGDVTELKRLLAVQGVDLRAIIDARGGALAERMDELEALLKGGFAGQTQQHEQLMRGLAMVLSGQPARPQLAAEPYAGAEAEDSGLDDLDGDDEGGTAGEGDKPASSRLPWCLMGEGLSHQGFVGHPGLLYRAGLPGVRVAGQRLLTNGSVS